jgi:succinate dehydrogenase/fumarate reductase cytochrome b subunit
MSHECMILSYYDFNEERNENIIHRSSVLTIYMTHMISNTNTLVTEKFLAEATYEGVSQIKKKL